MPPPVVSAALNKQKQAEDKRVHEQVFIKVEVGKLDQLINLVGELGDPLIIPLDATGSGR